MKRLKPTYFFLLLILVGVMHFLITPVFAHVPVFEEGGKSPETATHVEDPAKSRVLYGQLSGEDIQYYNFEMEKGERIVLGLIVPAGEKDRIYTPDLILMGPGIPDKGETPEDVKVPDEYVAK